MILFVILISVQQQDDVKLVTSRCQNLPFCAASVSTEAEDEKTVLVNSITYY